MTAEGQNLIWGKDGGDTKPYMRERQQRYKILYRGKTAESQTLYEGKTAETQNPI